MKHAHLHVGDSVYGGLAAVTLFVTAALNDLFGLLRRIAAVIWLYLGNTTG